MYEFSRALGDAVKRSRGELGLTQSQLAEAIDVDPRTVMNIENYRANPKLVVLFPLLRTLQIDPWEVFYPETRRERAPALRRLRSLVEDCGEWEAEKLLPVAESALAAIRTEAAAGPKT